MRITKGLDKYPVLTLEEADALDTTSKVIRELENKAKHNKNIIFDNYDGYKYSLEELEKIIQLFECLQKQMNLTYVSKGKESKAEVNG